jgi:hypothetical protein
MCAGWAETNVCICIRAGLFDQGFVPQLKMLLLTPPHHEAGLRRMAAGGVVLTNTKGIYYEWVRDLATHARVKSRINLSLPAGLTL